MSATIAGVMGPADEAGWSKSSANLIPTFENRRQHPRTPRLALVIPVHNEEDFIGSALHQVYEYLSEHLGSLDWRLIVAEDGSRDRSYPLALQFAKEHCRVVVLHHARKLGRGSAVKMAWKEFDSDVYAYLDADLATDMASLRYLVEKVLEGDDVVTGSRYTKASVVHRPLPRMIASFVYNLIVRTLFRTRVIDHQCGFKAVSRQARDASIRSSKFDDWFWDTELFILARVEKLKVREIPVSWREKRANRTLLKTLAKDVQIHGSGIAKLLFRP